MLLMYSLYFTFLDGVKATSVHRAHRLLSESTLILRTRRNGWTREKDPNVSRTYNFRIETDAAFSFARTNQLPNESLKDNSGRDLWAVRHRFPEEAVAIVLIIGVEITEAKFGINIPCDLTAERGRALGRDIRADPKTADVHLACKIKGFR